MTLKSLLAVIDNDTTVFLETLTIDYLIYELETSGNRDYAVEHFGGYKVLNVQLYNGKLTVTI
jgi:hypothetical protein